MNDQAIVEVTRGNLVESIHKISISVVDGDGKNVVSFGDVNKPVFPRSAVKAIQGLPLVESGAADAFGFGDVELSLACASHSAEHGHVRTARSMLERAGGNENLLECGGHWSIDQATLIHQTKTYSATPPAICNNCSGKHSGFVCTALHLKQESTGYIHPNHPIQQNVREAMQDLTGFAHNADLCGTDGCSIPTYAVPLKSMAHGFARMTTGQGLGTIRSQAAKRLLNACMMEPFYMAGTKRFCTEYMNLENGRLFGKTGAEGVFCGAIPELGVGIALKCEDGTTRAAEVAMAAITQHLLASSDPLQPKLELMKTRTMKNWNGIEVGQIRCHLPS